MSEADVKAWPEFDTQDNDDNDYDDGDDDADDADHGDDDNGYLSKETSFCLLPEKFML